MENNREFATFFSDAPKGKKIGAVLSWIATAILLVALFVPGFRVKFQAQDKDSKWVTVTENMEGYSAVQEKWKNAWDDAEKGASADTVKNLQTFVEKKSTSVFHYLSNSTLLSASVNETQNKTSSAGIILIVVLTVLIIAAVVTELYTISWTALVASLAAEIEIFVIYSLMFKVRFLKDISIAQGKMRFVPAMTAVLIALLVIAAILSVASVIVSYAVHSEEDAEGDAYWDDDDENRNAPTGLIDDNDTAPVTGSIPSASAAVATLSQMNTSKSFAIMNNTELVIGKGSQADVIVSNPIISRAHAKISCHNGTCTIQDLGSKNGTFVGDQKISGNNIVVLTDGMYITLGNEIFQFKV